MCAPGPWCAAAITLANHPASDLEFFQSTRKGSSASQIGLANDNGLDKSLYSKQHRKELGRPKGFTVAIDDSSTRLSLAGMKQCAGTHCYKEFYSPQQH